MYVMYVFFSCSIFLYFSQIGEVHKSYGYWERWPIDIRLNENIEHILSLYASAYTMF